MFERSAGESQSVQRSQAAPGGGAAGEEAADGGGPALGPTAGATPETAAALAHWGEAGDAPVQLRQEVGGGIYQNADGSYGNSANGHASNYPQAPKRPAAKPAPRPAKPAPQQPASSQKAAAAASQGGEQLKAPPQQRGGHQAYLAQFDALDDAAQKPRILAELDRMPYYHLQNYLHFLEKRCAEDPAFGKRHQDVVQRAHALLKMMGKEEAPAQEEAPAGPRREPTDMVLEQMAHNFAYKDDSWNDPAKMPGGADGHWIRNHRLSGDDTRYLEQKGYGHPQIYHGVAGLHMAAFRAERYAPVLAIRGTEGADMKSVRADVGAEIGIRQLEDNFAKITQVLAGLVSDGKVILTGHSLGGGVAQLIASKFPDVIRRVVTFQAPGVDWNRVADVARQNALRKERGEAPISVTHYRMKEDLVHLGGEQLLQGEVRQYGITKHDPKYTELKAQVKRWLQSKKENWNLFSQIFNLVEHATDNFYTEETQRVVDQLVDAAEAHMSYMFPNAEAPGGSRAPEDLPRNVDGVSKAKEIETRSELIGKSQSRNDDRTQRLGNLPRVNGEQVRRAIREVIIPVASAMSGFSAEAAVWANI